MNIYSSQQTDRWQLPTAQKRDEYAVISSWSQSWLFVRQTGIFNLLAPPLGVFAELQSYGCCLLLSVSGLLSGTNKDTPRELSTPSTLLRTSLSSTRIATLPRTSPSPTRVASPGQTKILRDSSALPATREDDAKISTLRAELFASTRVGSISPLTRGN